MKLRIGHLDYDVGVFQEDDEGFGVHTGLTDHEDQTIRIDADVSAARQLETLIHELVHAVFDAYMVKWVDGPKRYDEETVAYNMGAGFASIIRSNPKFLPMLEALRRGEKLVEV